MAAMVNIKVHTFSHYFQEITKPPMKRNELDKNSGVFPEILKNDVEVRLTTTLGLPFFRFTGAPRR